MLDIAARAPWVVLALCAGLTALAIPQALSLQAEVDFVATVPDHAGLEAYRDLLAKLDGVRFTVIYLAHDNASQTGSLRTDAGFDALVSEQEALTQYLEARFPAGTFSHTLSAYEGMKQGNYMLAKLATAGNAPPDAYAMPEDRFTYEQVRTQVRDGGSIDDVLAADGSSALMLVFFSTSNNAAGRALAGEVDAAVSHWAANARHHPATTDHATSGLLFASHYTDEVNRAETARWAPFAAVAVGLALTFALHRLSNALIAVTSLIVALIWTYGLMGALEVRISFLTVFLAPVVIGIGVDHAVHVLHRFEAEHRGGASPRDALSVATRRTGAAVIVAALTTIIGLAALSFVRAPLFAEIGRVAALGIALGLVAALTVAPALRAVIPLGRSAGTVGPTRGLGGVATRIARWPGAAVAVVVLLAAVSAGTAMTATRVESGSAENEFPQDDPVIRLQHRIEREYGAFQRAYLVVRGDVATPHALAALHQAGSAASSLPLARNASSVVDLLLADAKTDDGVVDIASDRLLAGVQQSPDDAQRLPRTSDEAHAQLDALFEDPLWRTLAPFTITRDYRLAVIAITIEPWTDQASLVRLRDALIAAAETLQADLGGGYDVDAAGAPLNRAAIIEETPHDVMIATLGAAAGVFAVLAIAWHRRGLAGIRLATAAAAVVLLASLMLLAAVPLLDAAYGFAHDHWGAAANTAALNDMFLLAFAVTVAVGVDDVVLLAHQFWESRDDGKTPAESHRAAFTQAGRAITATSITTFVAFATLGGVYFLQSKNLAILTAIGVVLTYGLTLAIAPLAIPRRG